MLPVLAIVGRPNVGKSTLFNRLTRSKRALVDNRPGITRDRLHGIITHEGLQMTLVDTGGFEDLGQDPLQKGVRAQVETAISEADRIIFMVDGREGVLPGDEEMAQLLRRTQKKVFLAANKIDGPEKEHLANDFYQLGYDTVYPLSAAHGYGVKTLLHDLGEGLSPSPDISPESYDEIRVAVLGKPNVGKSSLINRILKTDRLVVSELPGTTRDTVDTTFFYGGRKYLLIDTAGIRRKARVKEKVDTFSMIKAVKSLDRCHIAVLLLDGAEGVSDQDARICGYAFEKGRGIVLAVNKWDLIKGNKDKSVQLERGIERQLKFISFAPRINLSALTGERVMKLFSNIDSVYDQFSMRLSTALVNRAIGEIIEKHPPSRIGRGRLKFYYGTQTRTKPPALTIFVNRPDMLHFSYERFLNNQLRIHLGLTQTPLRLIFRQR
jgi:GTPase